MDEENPLEHILSDELEDTITDPEDMRVPIDKETIRALKDIGIINVFVVEFDPDLGPKLKFFANNSELLDKMLINPAFTAEITILAKYAQEVLLKDLRKIVIKEIIVNRKQFYIFVEVQKNYFSSKPLLFAKYLKDILEKAGNINKNSVKKGIRESLLLATKSTFGLTL